MRTPSNKQQEANRKNAQLGGVKTEAGKAVSRFNALKHGLLSSVILLPEENTTELSDLWEQMCAELKPVGRLELLLVDRIISNLWRLRRALKGEKEMMHKNCHPKNPFSSFGEEIVKNIGETFIYDFTNNDTYGKFTRYESSIERGLYRSLHELQRLQAIRSGQTVTTPIAIDVDINKE